MTRINIEDAPGGKMGRVVFMAFMCLLLSAFMPLQVQAYITVLLYHRFDENRFPTTTTSSTQFNQQMEYLKVNGYKVISMDELAECIEGMRSIPEKAVVITIDDGFISEYEKAIPILRQYQYPFCIFIFTHAVGDKNYMSWQQLKQLKSWGGEAGCHTYLHPRLINLTEKEIEKEIMGSKEIMEKGLGQSVRYFAYPFGQYDKSIRAIARRSGFRLMLTSDPGSVGKHTEVDRVPRQAIVGAETTLIDFAQKLKNPPLEVAKRIPPCGRLTSETLPTISLTLKDPYLYIPGQVNLFLSEKGRLKAYFDPIKGIVSSYGPVHLTRKTNRIIVTAKRRSDGLFAMDSYLIVLPGKPSPFVRMKYTIYNPGAHY
jgi:peptidoglycan/xylan/chitin deacetylase (PgdA/CDA1 family)